MRKIVLAAFMLSGCSNNSPVQSGIFPKEEKAKIKQAFSNVDKVLDEEFLKVSQDQKKGKEYYDKQIEDLKKTIGDLNYRLEKTENILPPIPAKNDNDQQLSGLWETTLRENGKIFIREVEFSSDGSVSSLDFVPGNRTNAKPPVFGTYSYQNGKLLVCFPKVRDIINYREKQSVRWMSSNSFESRLENVQGIRQADRSPINVSPFSSMTWNRQY